MAFPLLIRYPEGCVDYGSQDPDSNREGHFSICSEPIPHANL